MGARSMSERPSGGMTILKARDVAKAPSQKKAISGRWNIIFLSGLFLWLVVPFLAAVYRVVAGTATSDMWGTVGNEMAIPLFLAGGLAWHYWGDTAERTRSCVKLAALGAFIIFMGYSLLRGEGGMSIFLAIFGALMIAVPVYLVLRITDLVRR